MREIQSKQLSIPKINTIASNVDVENYDTINVNRIELGRFIIDITNKYAQFELVYKFHNGTILGDKLSSFVIEYRHNATNPIPVGSTHIYEYDSHLSSINETSTITVILNIVLAHLETINEITLIP